MALAKINVVFGQGRAQNHAVHCLSVDNLFLTWLLFYPVLHGDMRTWGVIAGAAHLVPKTL